MLVFLFFFFLIIFGVFFFLSALEENVYRDKTIVGRRRLVQGYNSGVCTCLQNKIKCNKKKTIRLRL